MGNITTQTSYEEMARFGTATIFDASGQNGLVDLDLIQVVPGSRTAGPARTLLLGPEGNKSVHEVMKHLIGGEILVITTSNPKPVALVGELLALQAQRAGIAGILVNGGVRDIEQLRELGLPIWARWVRAKGAAKKDHSEINVPVELGGTTIHPGDAVILDADGAVVVASENVERVLNEAKRRLVRESETRDRIDRGEYTFELYGFGDA